MSRRSGPGGLGRGLGALFGENSQPLVGAEATAAKEAIEVAIDLISPNPFQPRRNFAPEGLEELARSITQHGVVEPLIARPLQEGYQLVAGERRLRAAKLAGLQKVPLVVRPYSDSQVREIALVENINRHDLNPIEEAEGLRALMEDCGLTQEQVAEKVGRSRVAVTNILRLLNLCPAVQDLLRQGRISMGQARTLLGLPEGQQEAVAQAVIDSGWSTRMTEEVVRRLKEGKQVKITREIIEEVVAAKGKKGSRAAAPPPPAFSQEFESQARLWLGTKVKVLPLLTDKKGRQAGSIQIEYYSPEDLQRIYELLQERLQPERGQAQPSRAVKLPV